MQNSFKELEKLNIENRKHDPEEGKQKVNANINLFAFLSDVLDLYLPKVGNVIKSFDRGVKEVNKPKKYPNKK